MAFRPDPFLERFEPLRQMRRRPWIGYGAAVGGVGLATLLRFLVKGYASPFVMFYPFVIVATLIGGWRAGVLSTRFTLLLTTSSSRHSLLFTWPRSTR